MTSHWQWTWPPSCGKKNIKSLSQIHKHSFVPAQQTSSQSCDASDLVKSALKVTSCWLLMSVQIKWKVTQLRTFADNRGRYSFLWWFIYCFLIMFQVITSVILFLIQSLSFPSQAIGKARWSFVVHITFLEVHSKTVWQHSAKQLK